MGSLILFILKDKKKRHKISPMNSPNFSVFELV